MQGRVDEEQHQARILTSIVEVWGERLQALPQERKVSAAIVDSGHASVLRVAFVMVAPTAPLVPLVPTAQPSGKRAAAHSPLHAVRGASSAAAFEFDFELDEHAAINAMLANVLASQVYHILSSPARVTAGATRLRACIRIFDAARRRRPQAALSDAVALLVPEPPPLPLEPESNETVALLEPHREPQTRPFIASVPARLEERPEDELTRFVRENVMSGLKDNARGLMPLVGEAAASDAWKLADWVKDMARKCVAGQNDKDEVSEVVRFKSQDKKDNKVTLTYRTVIFAKLICGILRALEKQSQDNKQDNKQNNKQDNKQNNKQDNKQYNKQNNKQDNKQLLLSASLNLLYALSHPPSMEQSEKIYLEKYQSFLQMISREQSNDKELIQSGEKIAHIVLLLLSDTTNVDTILKSEKQPNEPKPSVLPDYTNVKYVMQYGMLIQINTKGTAAVSSMAKKEPYHVP